MGRLFFFQIVPYINLSLISFLPEAKQYSYIFKIFFMSAVDVNTVPTTYSLLIGLMAICPLNEESGLSRTVESA